MAGFLDKRSTIVDMILTSEGRRLLSKGELKFVYYTFLDDEVDYNPFISQSGSLTSDLLSASIDTSIQDTLMREAVPSFSSVGKDKYRNVSVNGNDILFDSPQGYSVLPRMTSSLTTGSDFILEATQRGIFDSVLTSVDLEQSYDRGYEVYDEKQDSLSFTHNDILNKTESDDTFYMQIFKSGSDGYSDVPVRVDSSGDVVHNFELVIKRK